MSNKPVHTLKRGALEAAIWANDSKDGIFHKVTFSRIGRDSEGKFANYTSFSESNLADLAVLALEASQWMRQQRSTEAAPKEVANA